MPLHLLRQLDNLTAILIPARYNSTRFPGKPLTKLGDRHMIQEVYVKCKESGLDTYVLTDHPLIADLFPDQTVVIDQSPYENGTERCAGALKDPRLDRYDKFINVQGDMPDVTVDVINAAHKVLSHYSVSTVVTEMPSDKQHDPNTVKLVRSADKCLWFGRGIVGYGDWHLGIYGYRRNALEMYPTLTVTEEETIEGLEQLRWLKGGWDVGVLPATFNGIEINTPEDAEKWNESR